LKLFEQLFSSVNTSDILLAFKSANQLPLHEKRFLKYHLNRVQKEWQYKMNKQAQLVREKGVES
jgi:hypothetical protein